MKKILLALFVCTATIVQGQTYLNTPWTLTNLTSIKDSLSGVLGDQYKLTRINFSESSITADIDFMNKEHQLLAIHFEKEVDVIADFYTIKGPFNDVLNIYSKWYNPTANADLLKKTGHAGVISKKENGIKYNVAFLRTGDDWSLIIRKVR